MLVCALAILTVVASLYYDDTTGIKRDLHDQSAQLLNTVEREITTISALLVSLQGILQTSENGYFTAVAEELISQYPHIKSVSTLEFLKDSELAGFQQRQHDLGHERFNIVAGTHDMLQPDHQHLILYEIEPLSPRSATFLGKDLSSSAELMQAALLAGRTGSTILLASGSYPASLSGKLVVLRAIYFGAFPLTTPDERLQQMRGVIAISLDPYDIFIRPDKTLKLDTIRLEQQKPEGGPVLYNYTSAKQNQGHVLWEYSETLPLNTPGQQLQLVTGAVISSSQYHLDRYITWVASTLLLLLVLRYLWRQNKSALMKIRTSNTAFNHMAEGVIVADRNAHIIAINNSFTRITGYSENEILGKNPRILASGQHDEKFYEDMWSSINNQGSWEGELWNRRKDGSVFPEHCSITAVYDTDGDLRNYVGIFTDITLHKQREEQILHMAHHDALTNLPNRTLLNDRLEQAMIHARRSNNKVAVLFIDLDHFKLINDSLGHNIGDLLLVRTAQALTEIVRGEDTVSRLGGDEFIIILRDVQETNFVMMIAARIISNLVRPVPVQEHQLSITCSIGISIYPDDGDGIEDLIKHADTAMYHAKASGRNNFQFYTESINRSLQKRVTIENTIREALINGGFELHYQPQYDLQNDSLVGAEALLRHTTASVADISTAEIIRVAEDSCLIGEVGKWVIREAFEHLAELNNTGIQLPSISINISARQLDEPDLISFIRDNLQHHNIDPRNLQFEITESTVMKNVDTASRILQEISGLGATIAIDDFGTGYSSLYYLSQLPISHLKIDRSFIHSIDRDNNKVSLVTAIVDLSRNMNLTSVAEGIENTREYDAVRNIGCDIGQGYYLSHPLPFHKFRDTILGAADQPRSP